MFASVNFNIGLFPPRAFEYRVPSHLEGKIQSGSLVWVPFRNRRKWAIVESLSEEACFQGKHLGLSDVVDVPTAITQEAYPLACWLSETYFSSLAQAAQTAWPLKFFLNLKPSRNTRPSQSRLNMARGEEGLKLTHSQQEALEKILQNFGKNRLPTYLLGPTGSGKTFVFLSFIRECLKENQSAIYLVPEITLTPQFVEIFTRALLPGTPFAVWSSQTPFALKQEILEASLAGHLRFVLGTRSAAFLPLKNLKTIIVDEEQDSSFKQENPPPAYHTRDVVLWRTRFNQGLALFASATPSLECYLALKEKRMLRVELPERYGAKALPKITLLPQESPKKTEAVFMEIVKEKVNNGEHVLIFHNRRGYARTLRCDSCKNNLSCHRCNLPLILHKNGKDTLRCHHCGLHKNVPTTCPVCQKPNLAFIQGGLGTQKIAETIQQSLGVPVLRLDRETSRQAETILTDFKKGQAPILVGTKLITKGLHFPRVSFVAVLNADTELYLPDFRSCERAFQSLTQVAGRAGRGEKPGEALLATNNPKHYVFESLAANQGELFYERELALRQELNLPPYSRLLLIEIRSRLKQKTLDVSSALTDILSQESDCFEFMGNAPGYFAKIRNVFRHQLVLKHKGEDLRVQKIVFDALRQVNKLPGASRFKILLHPDPYNLF